MFNWWSSLAPQVSESSENVGEKPAEGEQNTVEGRSGDGGTGKTDSQQKERSQDSKASELDYAKDMAKNVGSELETRLNFVVLVYVRGGSQIQQFC